MRPKELLELPAVWRTMRSPLRYLLARRGARGAAGAEVELRGGIVARLRDGTRDGHVFHRIFIGDEYRLRELDLEGGWVVDVGAHGGFFALRAAMAGARVLCVEPAPVNLELLRAQIARNRLEGRVVVRAGALGAKAGRATLRCDGDPYGYAVARAGAAAPAEGRALEVDCTTLEALLDEHGVDRCLLLKLDCEGSEYGILGAASDAALRRCERIRMELHVTPGEEEAPLGLRRRLEAAGFRVDLDERKRNGRQGYLFCTRAAGAAPAAGARPRAASRA